VMVNTGASRSRRTAYPILSSRFHTRALLRA
jgi:hypothetical protein